MQFCSPTRSRASELHFINAFTLPQKRDDVDTSVGLCLVRLRICSSLPLVEDSYDLALLYSRVLVKDKRLEIVRDKLIDSEAEKFELIT